MADNGSFPDDISELWESEDGSALTPAPPDGDAHVAVERTPAHGNGSGNGSAMTAMDHAIHSDVARLAEAIAGDQVRRADLEAVRTEFSHQLGVALYELLSMSNTSLAKAEDHINEQVVATVEAHTERLMAAIEAQSRASVEFAEAVRQDVHREAERLRGQMDAQATQSAQRLEAEAERRHRSEASAARAASELGDVVGTLAGIKEEVDQIRQDLTVLRGAVETQRRESRKWWRAR